MGRRTARLLYRSLLRLHPRSFRESFAEEMLGVFDDAAGTYGVLWLLSDAGMSAVRQRLWRSQEEVDGSGVDGHVALLAGIYPEIRSTYPGVAKLSLGFLLTLLSFFLFPANSPVERHVARSRAAFRAEVHYAANEVR